MKVIHTINNYLLSEKARKTIDHYILLLSIVGFLLHLLLIFAVKLHFFHLENHKELLSNPIAAIYTPFSFILFYEVYLLVYYLQKSFSQYIGKQYEIIILIVIRRVFKDLSTIQLSPGFFTNQNDINFLYDLVTVLITFALLYFFYRLVGQNSSMNVNEPMQKDVNLSRFIQIKVAISCFLIPVLSLLTIYSFGTWLLEVIYSNPIDYQPIGNINNIFFDQFFTILILTDVLLLLLSFYHSDKFNVVMRNSGFVISTILIKLSFMATGILNNILIIIALVFGLVILYLHNKFNTLNK